MPVRLASLTATPARIPMMPACIASCRITLPKSSRSTTMSNREGNLEAPTRHPLDWINDDFYDEDSLNNELERVFDICHGCRVACPVRRISDLVRSGR